MEKVAFQADSKSVMDGSARDNKLGTVCKTDLIFFAYEEDVRKSEALIDNFLKGEITTDFFPS